MKPDPKTIPDLPEPLREVLQGVPRTTFSRRPPRTKEESESGILWEVKDVDDLFARIHRRNAAVKK